MSDERGQALVLAVLMLAMAAVAIGGLRLAQDRILAAEQGRRAGEAAVEAAAAVVADALAAGQDVRGGAVAARARSAAADLSRRNGGGAVSDVAVACGARWTVVRIRVEDASYSAAIEATCSPR